MIEEMIEEADPDIIALQSVCQNPKGKDQARQIAEATGYGYYFFVTADTAANGTNRGQAMITKHPFIGSYSTDLSVRTDLPDSTRRLILVAEVQTQEGMLRIFNTHFSWVREQAQENVEETLFLLNEFSGPGLVIGELNPTAHQDVLEPLKKAGWEDGGELLSTPLNHVFINQESKLYLRQISAGHSESENRCLQVADDFALIVELDMTIGSAMHQRMMSSSRF